MKDLLAHLAWPWMLLALPLPWLLARFLPARRAQAPALRLPQAEARLQVMPALAGKQRAGIWLLALAWCLLCIAAARPQSLGAVVVPPQSGRDLMLALDISGSMQTQDMTLGGRKVSRLVAARAVLTDFLERRESDRIGLVVFAQKAYAIAPLTRDHESVRLQLRDAEVGMAGRETAIGDAIGLAIKRLRQQPAKHRVLILLTDGENTAGLLTPQKAAELAASEHVRIHTIAFGGEEDSLSLLGMRLPLPGMHTGIDEATLQEVAHRSGGQFFRARDATSLAGIYAEIDRLEPLEKQGQALRPRHEQYWRWLLAAGLPLLVAALLAARRKPA